MHISSECPTPPVPIVNLRRVFASWRPLVFLWLALALMSCGPSGAAALTITGSTSVTPFAEQLAGILSVIYGFIGLTLLAPLIRSVFGGPGLSVLTGAIILGFMILPSVIAISEDAMRAVPSPIREGAIALESTHWQVITGVILPTARSGIIAGIILGMGRALGETMAVIMMIGNSLDIPLSPLDPATTMTSNIGLELSYASGDHRAALFATGVVLFILIMLLNGVATAFIRRPTFSRRSS
jgi:ABC-type phosphate transport system permease subunit